MRYFFLLSAIALSGCSDSYTASYLKRHPNDLKIAERDCWANKEENSRVCMAVDEANHNLASARRKKNEAQADALRKKLFGTTGK